MTNLEKVKWILENDSRISNVGFELLFEDEDKIRVNLCSFSVGSGLEVLHYITVNCDEVEEISKFVESKFKM